MKMRLLIITLLCPIFILAQNHKIDNKREVEKVGFLTTKLDLTSEDAQIFWPIYNEFSNERSALQKEKIEHNKNLMENIDQFSDIEIGEYIDKHIIFLQKHLDLRKKFHSKFKKTLSTKQIAQLYHAEERFKAVLLKRFRESDNPTYRKRR